ncbi:phosphodiesterase [Roseibium sp. MMSF_3544]|uniref:phosphodiesterase n=1 Tax=unclassified Roseibium TaxID=2629323 RepID=UPI00273FA2C8|nr:phosphodiesterase [Roseibium sp. MMSF_3544]
MTLIAQITDLHLRPRGLACYRVSDTNMMAERAIRSLQALSPKADAIVVTGDLTDRSDPREYAVARELLSRLEAPVYLMPGNHDSSDGMRREMADFPGLQGTKDGKIFYAATIGAVRLVALDSHLPGRPQGQLGQEQLTWLDATLRESTKPTLVALHHPPSLSGIVHMDNMGLIDADALEEVLKPHAHVDRILCGHIHRPIITSFAGKVMTLAPSTGHQVALDLSPDGAAMFNFEPAAYFLHYHTEKTGIVTHMAYVENFPGPYHFFADEGVTWPGDEM